MSCVCLNCGHPIDVKMDVIEWGLMSLDRPNFRAEYDGRYVHLTKIEFGIVEKLMLACGEVVPIKVLAKNNNSLKVHMSHIRTKIDDDPFEGIYGVGYRYPKGSSGDGKSGA